MAGRTIPLILMVTIAALLCSCSREPITVGFIGGLSGKGSDLGVPGRNGALLAIEEANRSGGIDGHPLRLLDVDDGQDAETAGNAVRGLLARRAVAIIGPMTSMVALAITPLLEESGTPLVSPTVTTKMLAGKDDLFIRVCSTTKEYAVVNARAQRRHFTGNSAVVLYDQQNGSYTQSWLDDYRREFQRLGGNVVAAIPFLPSPPPDYRELARKALASRPAVVVIIANSVDGAMLCQSIRRENPRQQIAVAEWAATERFIELSGKSAEGVIVTQFFKRDDTSPEYQRFLQSYRDRFRQEPGFSGVASYDAARVIIDALKRRRGTEPLKPLIVGRTYQGVQYPLAIDRFGDAERKNHASMVKNGRFLTVEE